MIHRSAQPSLAVFMRQHISKIARRRHRKYSVFGHLISSFSCYWPSTTQLQIWQNDIGTKSYREGHSRWELDIISANRRVLFSLLRCNGVLQRRQGRIPTLSTPDSPHKNWHIAKRPLGTLNFQLHHAGFPACGVFRDRYSSSAETKDTLRIVVISYCYTRSSVYAESRRATWNSNSIVVITPIIRK